MPPRRNIPDADRPRIAPGTIVGWFVGRTEHTGRVVMNIPGTQYNHGTVVVKGSDGAKRIIRIDKVHIKLDQG